MAFLFRRKDSPYWWIRFRDPSTGETKQQSTELRASSNPETRQARALVAEKTAAELRAPQKVHSVDRWDRWVIDYLKARYSETGQAATRQRVLYNWSNISCFLEEMKIDRPRQVRRDHCFEYIRWRASAVPGMRKAIHNTALLELKTLSVIMAEAIRRGWAEENPCRSLGVKRSPPAQKPAIDEATLGQIHALIWDEPEPLRTTLLRSFLIGRYQGCRLRETHLNPQTDVTFSDDLSRGVIVFRAKGGKDHVAPLHPELLDLFKELKASGVSETFPMPTCLSALSGMWLKFFKRTGLRKSHPGICFHSLRVTAVTRLARSNVPESKAMAFIGHASSTVHRIYQRLRLDDLTDCFGPLGSS